MCVRYEKSLLNRKGCSQREISMNKQRESEVLELNERESQNRREREHQSEIWGVILSDKSNRCSCECDQRIECSLISKPAFGSPPDRCSVPPHTNSHTEQYLINTHMYCTPADVHSPVSLSHRMSKGAGLVNVSQTVQMHSNKSWTLCLFKVFLTSRFIYCTWVVTIFDC